MEQFRFNAMYGIQKEQVDLNMSPTKEVLDEEGTASIWDLGYESPLESLL